MERFAKDYHLLLKIRSIRADRAEREMAAAEALRQKSQDYYQNAATASQIAKATADAASAARYPRDVRSLDGATLHQMNKTATLARARFQDSEQLVHTAAADLAAKAAASDAARSRFAKEQRIVIKTETVLEELKNPSS